MFVARCFAGCRLICFGLVCVLLIVLICVLNLCLVRLSWVGVCVVYGCDFDSGFGVGGLMLNCVLDLFASVLNWLFTWGVGGVVGCYLVFCCWWWVGGGLSTWFWVCGLVGVGVWVWCVVNILVFVFGCWVVLALLGVWVVLVFGCLGLLFGSTWWFRCLFSLVNLGF